MEHAAVTYEGDNRHDTLRSRRPRAVKDHRIGSALVQAVALRERPPDMRPRRRQKRRASPVEADLGNGGPGSRAGEPGADRGAQAQ